MQKNARLTLGIAFAAVLFFGASLALVVDIFLRVPDFTVLRSAVKVPIRLANGDDSFKMMGPRTPGWEPLRNISPFLPRAIVASEDTSFYSHNGIDVHEIKEAIKKDWAEKRFARGASTLTQQVLKNVFLGSQKTIWRKVKEILWARDMEKVLSKSEIIQFYMNMAEWGPGIYGVREAAQHYFGTSPSQLSARQSAFLTMLLPSPRRYHAYFRKKQLTQWAARRVNRILEVMNRMGFLEDAEYQQALAEQLWGLPVLPDTAPGVPADPGNVTESSSEDFETPSEGLTVLPAVPAADKTLEPSLVPPPTSEGETEAPEKNSEEVSPEPEPGA